MNGLKIIVAFMAGAGCGIFGTMKYFEKKYREIADEEIESVIDIYKTKEEVESYAEKKQYHKYVDNYISSAPLDMVVDRELMERQEHPEDDEPEEQYQITSMDFFDDSEYDKVNVTYYINDETLIGPSDEKDDDILDIVATIGEEAVELITNGFDDGSALYIRNPKTNTDYEITKSYMSYKDLMVNG